MIINNLPSEFEEARPIMQAIENAGFEAYFVGGSVRDTILKHEIHDVDIATSAYPEEIKKIFKHTVDTGIEHGTVMILDHGEGYETTTFRTESGYQDFRRPDEVTFVRSLKEDLKRRDFTINALAMRENGEVIDLFNGLDDLQNHVIRTVGKAYERFHEDALRMMRAVRFAGQLNFEIESETLIGIEENSELLEKIAVERIRVELEKLCIGKYANNGIKPFVETGLYKYCPNMAPYLDKLNLISNGEIPELTLDTEVWAFISYMFELKGLKCTQFLKSWKTSNQVITDVLAIHEVMEAIINNKLNEVIIYKSGRERSLIAQKLSIFFDGKVTIDEIKKIDNLLPIRNKGELKVDGGMLIRQLGIKPGPLVGKLLETLENKVVTGDLINDEEILIEYSKQVAAKEG